MRYLTLALAALGLAAGGLHAEPLTGKDARKQLFKSKVEFVVAEDGGLSETHLGYFRILFGTRAYSAELKQFKFYYGALAVSPTLFEKLERGDLQLTGEVPIQLAQGYHSPEAADAAALAACNAVIESGDKKCVVGARLFPKNWEPRDLTLSAGATEAFKLYRKTETPRAFARSTNGQAFGIAKGEEAVSFALQSCHDKIEDGAKDCEVVIEDK